MRNAWPYRQGVPSALPGAIRARLRMTARDMGSPGFDFDYGYGIVDGCAILERVHHGQVEIDNPCIGFRQPWYCYYDFCHRYPRLCQLIDERLQIGDRRHAALTAGLASLPGPETRAGGQLGRTP